MYPIRNNNNIKYGGSQKETTLALVEAINYNQLFLFLIANLLTGMTNIVINSLCVSDMLAIAYLLAYMNTNAFIAAMAYKCNVAFKFW